jgi:hypothetical protein
MNSNKKAILAGKWSKNGNKFAVGTGGKEVFIGYYDKNDGWYSTKQIKGFKSSVLSVQFYLKGFFSSEWQCNCGRLRRLYSATEILSNLRNRLKFAVFSFRRIISIENNK